MTIELKGDWMNTNKLHLFYVPITLADDLILKKKKIYRNHEIREGIHVPEVVPPSLC